jgi:cellulose synthase/poly-beta-1,6-N-acetylglucosamine synthase-like glycosyltransferase
MIVLIFIFSLLLLYYLSFLVGISKGIKKVSQIFNQPINNEFVSVIIPFRNEENNILVSLNSIVSQSVPKDRFEVIYIDDNSEDKSFRILEESNKPNNVRILKSPVDLDERAHKKKALKFAIENCNGDIIITTDADCYHNSTWLETIINYFDSTTAFVSGPVQFESNGKIFQELQKLEFSSLILVGAGLIGINTPIICNAANLGFRKSVFDKVGGYEDNLNLSSGDDEFLMQKISRDTDYKIKFCFNTDAIAYTNPNNSISEFYQQRKRWASKGFYYNDKMITIKLIFIFLFYISIPIHIILGFIVNPIFLVSALVCFLLKVLFEYNIVQIKSKKLFPKTNLIYFIIAEVLHIPYILISGIAGIFGNYKWKGRNIKR